MIDNQKQRPYNNKNQVEQTKNNVPRAINLLTGHFANSMNGGHNKTIYWKQIMAGERHREFNIQLNMQMLTPLTPAYQKLNCTLRTYFVPNSRVWKNAEKFTAQNEMEGTGEKITTKPNLQGKIIPIVVKNEMDKPKTTSTSLNNTTIWRDSFISSYLGRPAWGGQYQTTTNQDTVPEGGQYELPAIDVLPLRGRVAIYNDYERYKAIEAEKQEYNGDTVSETEWRSYLPVGISNDNDPTATNIKDTDFFEMRARRNNSYYSNIREWAQGFEEDIPNIQNNEFINWASWEAKIAEARSQAENVQKTPWEVIAEIRGTKKLTEGKVQLISEKTFPLNYSAITQSAYNNNQEIKPEFQVMGKQGAYSYTETKVTLFSGMEFIEEGYIHVIATVSADTVFEKQFDRTLLNVNWEDNYRPDLKDDKLDTLKYYEVTTIIPNNTPETNYSLGFKRKYSELFKMPNIIGGDMTSENYFKLTKELDNVGMYIYYDGTEYETNKTYQFFETDIFNIPTEYTIEENNANGNNTQGIPKKFWKDYTDIMINKNQAVKNELLETDNNDGGLGIDSEDGKGNIRVEGQNQIFFVGIASCIAELPVDKAIADNYTTWGEH